MEIITADLNDYLRIYLLPPRRSTAIFEGSGRTTLRFLLPCMPVLFFRDIVDSHDTLPRIDKAGCKSMISFSALRVSGASTSSFTRTEGFPASFSNLCAMIRRPEKTSLRDASRHFAGELPLQVLGE